MGELVNEDEHGITPPNETSMTVEPAGDGNWRVTIEQGNGDVIKTLDLTEMERLQLAFMLGDKMGAVAYPHCSFTDVFR